MEAAQETFVRLEQLRHEREEHQADEVREVIFDVAELSVLYGSFRAVRDVTLPVYKREITALIGPSGCGKTTVLRCFNRMNDLIEGAQVEGRILLPRRRPVRPGRRPGRGPAAHRHGVPEAQPVPEVHLRQRRLRAQDRRVQGEHGRAGRAVAAQGGAVGRGQGQAARSRAWRCRAGSSSGCASPGPSPWSPT